MAEVTRSRSWRRARRWRITAGAVLAVAWLGAGPARAQARDGLLNGALIGGAVGAAAGIAFTHAVRDSDLVASQYARSGIIFGALGAALGLGVDALFERVASSPLGAPRRVRIVPVVSRHRAGVAVTWRPRRAARGNAPRVSHRG
jgi:hypothetical protein